MGEKERKEDVQTASNEAPTEQTLPTRPEVSCCANLSVLFSASGAFISFLCVLFAREDFHGLACTYLLAFICLVTAGILGIAGLISILLSKGKRCGLKRNIVALVITALGLWLGVILARFYVDGMTAMYSAVRMKQLSYSLVMYENDHGCMSDPEQWCDLLLQNDYTRENDFKPYSDGCPYAFNKHLIGCSLEDIPGDVVVLFESKHTGWNQVGGAELLATTEYRPQRSWGYWQVVSALGEGDLGIGSFVLFGNGNIERVKPEEYDTLRWHVPQD